MRPAPALSGIAAAAGDEDTHHEVLDGLIAAWLIGTGRRSGQCAAGDFVLPGWCHSASAAERLSLELLPAWRLDVRSGHVVLRPPEGQSECEATGAGPTLARAILAATFCALLSREIEPAPAPSAEDPANDTLRHVRRAMHELLAEGHH